MKKSKVVFGFGLGDDWSFEKDFQKLSGAKIICFDGHVNLRFWFIRFCKDIIDFILLKKKSLSDFQRFYTFLNYKLFFNGRNATHRKKIIAPIDQYIPGIDKLGTTDLNQILHNKEHFDFFLKVDIEQHEYRILDQIIKYQKRLTGLVIEFHECDIHFEKIKKFIAEFGLQLVHVHVNNFGIINKLLFILWYYEVIFSKRNTCFESMFKTKIF